MYVLQFAIFTWSSLFNLLTYLILSSSLPVYLSTYLTLILYLPHFVPLSPVYPYTLTPSLFTTLSLSLSLSVFLPLCVSVSLSLCFSLSLCLSFSLSRVSVSVSLYLSLSLCLCLCLCLSVSFPPTLTWSMMANFWMPFICNIGKGVWVD